MWVERSAARLTQSIILTLSLIVQPLTSLAQEEVQAPSKPVAVIGASIISAAEVDRISAGRPSAYAGLPPEERRARIIDSLVAEYLIDYFYGEGKGQLSPAVLDGLNDARRQVLLQFFVQSQFTPPKIDMADVEAFIEANPQLFSNRRSYHFAVLTFSGGTPEVRAGFEAQVASLVVGPQIAIAALDALVARAPASGVQATLNTAWQPSEALPEDIRARLDLMVRDARQVDILRDDARSTMTILNSAVAMPLAPGLLHKKIEQRLIEGAFSAHREVVIQRMAQSVLSQPLQSTPDKVQGGGLDGHLNRGPADLKVALPAPGSVVWPSRPTVPRNIRQVALFSAGLFGTLATAALLRWFWMVAAQHKLYAWYNTHVPCLRRWRPALCILIMGLSGVTSSAVFSLPVAWRLLGGNDTALLLSVGMSLALSLALIWYIIARVDFGQLVQEESDKHDDIAITRMMLLQKQSPGSFLAAATGFLAIYAASLALLLDSPLGLS